MSWLVHDAVRDRRARRPATPSKGEIAAATWTLTVRDNPEYMRSPGAKSCEAKKTPPHAARRLADRRPVAKPRCGN